MKPKHIVLWGVPEFSMVEEALKAILKDIEKKKGGAK